MGGAASRPHGEADDTEIKAMESRFSSIGLLPDLRTVFHGFSSSSSSSSSSSFSSISAASIDPVLLQECFQLRIEWADPSATSDLTLLKQNLASAVIDAIFMPSRDGISWQSFLKGVEKCRQRSISSSLKLMLCCFCHLQKRAELPITCSFSTENINQLDDISFAGHINVSLLQDFLWLSWLMGCDSVTNSVEGLAHELPDIQPLVKSAQKACFATDELPVEKIYKWMLLLLPGLPLSLTAYVQAQLLRQASKFKGHNAVTSSMEVCQGSSHEPNSSSTQSSVLTSGHSLLTSGVAWTIGLSHPDSIGQNLVPYSFHPQEDISYLLYRASLHGKGMNRFWVNVEGYHGPALLLIQGNTNEESVAQNSGKKKTWLVGAFIKDGFESKLGYYGSKGCCIFALDPVMQPFRSTGTASNFVYTSPHASSNKSYFGQLKRSTGIGFGGEIGKERLWIDEDFMCVTVRHHAVDKTYETGHLVPDQGYATIEGKVLEIEVWGLGGAEIRENQAKLQERKNLFVEQKRKIDLGNWVDSPEKIMMDMVSDPTKVQREER